MKKNFLISIISIAITCLFGSCSKTDSSPTGGSSASFSCSGISPKFAADVQPIFTTVCSVNTTCHATGSFNSGGPFTTHAEIFAKKSDIRTAVLSRVMPQTGSLTQAQINNLICWIDSGAPNN